VSIVAVPSVPIVNPGTELYGVDEAGAAA